MGQQRHMAEEVVEDIRLFQIVELAFLANPPSDGKAPIGQMVEEFLVGDQAGNRDDPEPGEHPELLVDPLKIRNSVRHVEPPQVFVGHEEEEGA